MLEKGQRKEGRNGGRKGRRKAGREEERRRKNKMARNLTIRLRVSYFQARLLGISSEEGIKQV